MKENYYRPSGKFTVSGMLMLFLAVALSGILLAIPYLFIIRICPIIYLNIVLAALYGGGIGVAASFICKKFKIRNIPVSCIVMGVGTLVYTYFKWLFYINYTFTEESYVSNVPDLIAEPGIFWDCIRLVNKVGTWGMSSRYSQTVNTNVTGVFLALIWIGEIVIIAVCSYLIMAAKLKTPFIESDNDWAEKDSTPYQFDFLLDQEKSAILMNPDSVLNYPKHSLLNSTAPYVSLKLYHSSDFAECYYELCEMRYNHKNKRYEAKSGVNCLKTSPMFYENLRNKFLNLTPAAPVNSAPAEKPADSEASFAEAIWSKNNSAEEKPYQGPDIE